MAVSALRDALLEALKELPGTREFHLHALVSSPRKHNGLFPFAIPKQRSYLQDILILLSEQKTPDSPSIIVTGIEASLYHVPTTSCAVLYVSKVDSTGHASSPSPTSALVRAFLSYYANRETRPLDVENLWIQLFARAQNQYLFPNSSEFSGKRPLSDARLCGWWKNVLTGVAADLTKHTDSKPTIRLHYLLPGYSQLEAESTLKISSSSSSSSPAWTYGHPYSQTDVRLPCPSPRTGETSNLGHYIPYFDDCPKSRFLDEIALTTESNGVKSPARKRSRTNSNGDFTAHSLSEQETSKSTAKPERPSGALEQVTPDEFWERMSFRQECVAGAVTGFFTVGVTYPKDDTGGEPSARMRSAKSPLEPQPGEVSSQLNKRVLTSMHTGVEFATRELAIHATETLESAIRGLCEGISSIHTPIIAPRAVRPPKRDLKRGEDSSSSLLLPPPPPRTPPSRTGRVMLQDVSPNPFPEPEASLETYRSHIYGSVCVSNAELPVKTVSSAAGGGAAAVQPVTVLTARKKKKPT